VISDAIIGFIIAFVGPLVNGVLPHLAVTSFVTTVVSGAGQCGAMLRVAGLFIPIPVVFGWFAALVVVLPVLGVYIAGQWIWDHIPVIFGCGTG
jgi:hypothetical protein